MAVSLSLSLAVTLSLGSYKEGRPRQLQGYALASKQGLALATKELEASRRAPPQEPEPREEDQTERSVPMQEIQEVLRG